MYANIGRLTFAAITTVLALLPVNADAQRIRLTNLGTLERAFSSASAVLPDGTILGQVSNPHNDREQAFLYTGGQRIHLTLGGKFSIASYDSQNGLITGRATLQGEDRTHPFFVDSMTAVDMGTLGGSIAEVMGGSKNGRFLVGWSFLPGDAQSHAFRYDTQLRTMENLGGAGGAQAFADLAADDGRAIGSTRTPENRRVSFLYDSAGTHLFSLGGPTSEARFTPVGEHVVGNADLIGPNGNVLIHAFAYGPNGFRELTFGGRFGQLSVLDENAGVNGNVVGFESQESGAYRAFIYNFPADRFMELTPPGATSAMALAQTADGKVVGSARGPDGFWRAFIYDVSADVYRTIGLGGESWINDWNPAGQFVGGSFLPGGSAFRAYVYDWNADTTTPLGTLGGDNSDAREIADDGRIIGASNTSGATGSLAFLLDSSGMHPLSLGGDVSFAEFINGGAQVIGSSLLAGGVGEHVFEYDGSGIHGISLGGSFSVARFFNSSGKLVGVSDVPGDAASRGFYYDCASNATLDFGTFGGPYSEPSGINDQGVMAGNSQISQGSNYHAFLATIGASDDGPPATSFMFFTSANGAGWFKSDVTIQLVAEDEAGGSGLKEINYSASGAQPIPSTTAATSPVQLVISSEGETTITFTATDNGGNTSVPKSLTVKLDKTAPVISVTPASGEWSREDISVHVTASDSLSGLANGADSAFTLTTSVAEGTETANASTGTRIVMDVAGNDAVAGPVSGLKVDKKAPEITVTTPSGESYLLHQAVNAAFSVTDGGSGVGSIMSSSANGSPLDTSTVGTKTFTVSASDRVGNLAVPVTRSYTVSFGIKLLYDSSRAVRSGAAYPIKLQLVDANGVNVSSPDITLHALGVRKTSESTTEDVDDAGNSNEDDNFRFSEGLGGSPGGYIFNLKTRGLGSGTYEIVFTAGADPEEHSARFRVR